jgi:hypothetical protein
MPSVRDPVGDAGLAMAFRLVSDSYALSVGTAFSLPQIKASAATLSSMSALMRTTLWIGFTAPAAASWLQPLQGWIDRQQTIDDPPQDAPWCQRSHAGL